MRLTIEDNKKKQQEEDTHLTPDCVAKQETNTISYHI
jgi:hypothetical protein